MKNSNGGESEASEGDAKSYAATMLLNPTCEILRQYQVK